MARSYEWDEMFKKAFGNDSRKFEYFAYVDCRNTELPIADFLVTIDASRGRFTSPQTLQSQNLLTDLLKSTS